MGLCKYGEGGPYAASGKACVPGVDYSVDFPEEPTVPVNPSGGLLACGHPVGASGIMQGVFAFWQLQLGILQVLLDGPLQLPKGKYSLHYSACPHRMTAGQQATGWVHRHGRLLWKVHAVINAGNTGLATCRVGPAFTVFAETHVLVGLDL